MKTESECRKINGYSLTLTLTSQKLIIRALQDQTSDLYICEYRRGQLPQEIQFFYQTEQIFFDALLADEDVKISEQRLIIPYTTYRLNRPVKREFTLALTKVEANQIEELKKKVAVLESGNQKIIQLEGQMREHMKMLANLEKRTCFYYYNPGVFRSLVLTAENNSLYRIYGNLLSRKPSKPIIANQYYQPGLCGGSRQMDSREKVSGSLISNQPIGVDISHFSFKIEIAEQTPQGKAMIGLCIRIPERVQEIQKIEDINNFKFIIPFNQQIQVIKNADQISQRNDKTIKKVSCEIFYTKRGVKLKKGDRLVMTVNLEQSHITWYLNEVSLERSYFENPLTNIYPFVSLQPNMDAAF